MCTIKSPYGTFIIGKNSVREDKKKKSSIRKINHYTNRQCKSILNYSIDIVEIHCQEKKYCIFFSRSMTKKQRTEI